MGCGDSKSSTTDNQAQPAKPVNNEKQAKNEQAAVQNPKNSQKRKDVMPDYKLKRPEVIFVIGGPGSGKGTQCDLMVEEFGFEHLSTGDLLRAEKDTGSETADLINECLREGRLVPTSILIKLLADAMQKFGWNKTYLIDGFPRGQENLDVWNEEMKDKCDLELIFFFDLDEETMRKRLLKRGETSGRSDDNSESIVKRFKTFQDESAPLLDQFREMDIFRSFDASRTKEEVFNSVCDVLDKWLAS